jgi:hypothetical protein
VACSAALGDTVLSDAVKVASYELIDSVGVRSDDDVDSSSEPDAGVRGGVGTRDTGGVLIVPDGGERVLENDGDVEVEVEVVGWWLLLLRGDDGGEIGGVATRRNEESGLGDNDDRFIVLEIQSPEICNDGGPMTSAARAGAMGERERPR